MKEFKKRIVSDMKFKEFVTAELTARDGDLCGYCGIRLSSSGPVTSGGNISGRTLDHVVPTSSGGTDALDNLVLSCAPCNRAKLNLDATRFLTWLSHVRSRRFAIASSLIRKNYLSQLEKSVRRNLNQGVLLLNATDIIDEERDSILESKNNLLQDAIRENKVLRRENLNLRHRLFIMSKFLHCIREKYPTVKVSVDKSYKKHGGRPKKLIDENRIKYVFGNYGQLHGWRTLTKLYNLDLPSAAQICTSLFRRVSSKLNLVTLESKLITEKSNAN